MGQEIPAACFTAEDYRRFADRLRRESDLLADMAATGRLSRRGPVVGCEIEACLVDMSMQPAPSNERFLECYDGDDASAELAKFDIEFNTTPLSLSGPCFNRLHQQIDRTLDRARTTAASLGVQPILTGILPTLRDDHLTLAQLSNLNRYHALNERVIAARHGRPIDLCIVGDQTLESSHSDVMLEAAATSFQTHWQVPLEHIVRYYNAALRASAPLTAVAANSPFLFGHELWAETRIPLFEQAVPIGGFAEAADGPLQRVSFGTGWCRRTIVEIFLENESHFPILLPVVSESRAEDFCHLRLHNGTIWRWVRPVLGFDDDGVPHIRIEHRTLPAGPSTCDMIANAAFYFGLVESEAWADEAATCSFAEARDNFYLAARLGLAAMLSWRAERRQAAPLIVRTLLPRAREGLVRLGIDGADIERYLGVIEARASTGLTGSEWQKRFMRDHAGEFAAMAREYLDRQTAGDPVHTWPP